MRRTVPLFRRLLSRARDRIGATLQAGRFQLGLYRKFVNFSDSAAMSEALTLPSARQPGR